MRSFRLWLVKRLSHQTAAPSQPPLEIDWQKSDIDLISNLFGVEEAKKQLLNLYQPKDITPDQVLKDANAVELMRRTYPWKIYEQAVWRRFLNSMQLSLAAKTLEDREMYRSQVKAYLSVMHLPYELSQEKERIEKSREMMREAQNTKL